MSKKEEKKAIVAEGRTVWTKKGVAFPPAPVTADMLKGGSSEYYNLLKEGALIRPSGPKEMLSEGSQISIDYLDEEPGDSGEPVDPGSPEESPDSGESDEKSKIAPGGAKRKKK